MPSPYALPCPACAPAAQETAGQYRIADPSKIVPLDELDYIMLALHEMGSLWAVHEAHAIGADSSRAELARLKESLEILGQRADLEKMRADIAEEKVARLQSDLQQAQDELQGALVAEKAYISANNERIALLGQVARLEKERDSWRRVAERLEGEKAAAEARIRELEEKK